MVIPSDPILAQHQHVRNSMEAMSSSSIAMAVVSHLRKVQVILVLYHEYSLLSIPVYFFKKKNCEFIYVLELIIFKKEIVNLFMS